MKFIKVLLEKLSTASASTAIKSAASGIAEHIDLGNPNKEEIYKLIGENLSKYNADKNVSNFLISIDKFQKSSNLKIGESLDKILKTNINGDLKLTALDLKERLDSNPEYSLVNETLSRLKPFRWSIAVKESLDEIETSTKENGISSMLNSVIDQLLEDETTNANAIQTLTQAYHLPETDIRHYLLAEFNGKVGIYPAVDEFINKLVAMGGNLDVETIKYNIDAQGRHSTSIPMSPVVQEGNRKFFMIRNRIVESWNGKVRIMESAKRIPADFLALCNAFTKVKLNEHKSKKKSFIFESQGNQMQISEDVGGEGYQIQLNKDQLGGDMTTYESEIEDFGAQADIPQADIKDFLCLMGNFKAIGTLDNVVSVEINDNVGLDIIKADGGMFISVYDKSADTMQIADIKDDSAIAEIDDQYGVDVHEFLNEDETDGTVDEPTPTGGGAEFTDDVDKDKDGELQASLKELQDQLDEASENFDKLDALDDDYKDDAVNELIGKLKNTKEQLEAEIKEIQILLGNENVTNEVAAKAMVDLETIVSQSVTPDEVEDSVFKNCETTNIDDKFSLTPIVEFIKDDKGEIKIGGIFIRIDSLDENVDILPILQEKFDNLVDDNMIPILDEVVDVEFEQLSTLQAKIDTIVNKLEGTDTPEPKPEGDENEEPPVEDPNESKVNESGDFAESTIGFPITNYMKIVDEANGMENIFTNNDDSPMVWQIKSDDEKQDLLGYWNQSSNELTILDTRLESWLKENNLLKTNEGKDKPNEKSIRNFKKTNENNEDELKNYGLTVKFDTDKTTDKGITIPKGKVVKVDIVSKGPDSTWWLMPVTMDGKFSGYLETETPWYGFEEVKDTNENNEDELKNYGLKIKFNTDRTTDKGITIPKGKVVKVDIVSKGPDSTWWLMPVTMDGKFSGYLETETPWYGFEEVKDTDESKQGKTLIYKPVANKPENQATISKKFDELVAYLEGKYKNGDEFSMNVNGDYLINNEILQKDSRLFRMVNVVTTDVVNEPEQINESSEQEIVYMAPANRKSLEKYNEKIAKIINDTDDMLTIEFEDGKQLTSVPKTQVRFIGSKTNESKPVKNADYLDITATKVETDENGFSILIEDKDNNFSGYMDIYIKDNDVVAEWNKYIFNDTNSKDKSDKQYQDSNFEECSSVAISYLENKGLINQDNDGNWSRIDESKINESQLKPLFVFSTDSEAWTIFSVEFPESNGAQDICDAVSVSVDEEPGSYTVFEEKEIDGFNFIWCENLQANDFNIIAVPVNNVTNKSSFEQMLAALKSLDKHADLKFISDAIVAPFVGTLSESSEPTNPIKKTDLVKLWDELYGEDFTTQYKGLYKKLKDTFTLDELVKAWDEMYGEDFKTEYGGLYNKFTIASKYPEFRDFVKELYTVHSLAFHPDDSFADYVKMDSDEPLFTPEEAQTMQDKWDSLVKDMSDDDMYDVIYDVRRELSLDDLGGGQQ